MKKITAIIMVALVMTALLLPSVMAASPERGITVVGTKAELPEATAESPDFVFVQDESIVYAKVTDDEGNVSYVPETELGTGYVVTEEQTWWKGTKEGLTFRSTAPYAKFVDVYVDGKLVAKDNYKDSEGSTVIELTADYLETLEVGDHTITILSNDGSGSCPFHVKAAQSPAQDGGKSQQTGDTSNTWIWAAIALISVGAIGVVALTLVKTRKSTEK